MKNFYFIFILFCALNLKAQDPHFSQFYNSPLSLNPALTGLMNYDARFMANYRSQWSTVTVPFVTISASAELSVLKGFSPDDFFGVGLMLMNDKAGDSELRNTQVQISSAYAKALNGDSNNYLSIGGQFGFAQQSVNYANLLFDSQYDGDVLNPGISNNEDFAGKNVSYVDFSAGISWFFVPNPGSSFYAGLSMAHLNAPNVSFNNEEGEILYRKFTGHVGGEINTGGSISIIPNAVVLMQGPHTEVNVGAAFKYQFSEPDIYFSGIAISAGTSHRWNDAQIVSTRFDYGPMSLSLSYDFNISTLKRASRSQGGPEIAIIYRTNIFQGDVRAKQGPIRCPGIY